MIDSRDFIAAKRRAETEVMLPPGPKIALTGGLDFNDHHLIWDRLDKVHAKHPDMVLIHGGSPKGAELIASKWATNRKVPQIAFKPDWTKHAKAAPFKRNDAMLELLPIGVMHFPGTGIQDNLADKAKRLGIRRLEVRRRVSAVLLTFRHHQGGVACAATPPRFDSMSKIAPWWWWKARPFHSMHMEPPPCLPLDLFSTPLGIGLFCWLIFALAVYALPFFVAVSIGMLAFHSGAGVVGALLVGIAAGGIDACYRSNRFRNDSVHDLACRDRGRFRCPGRHCWLSCGSRDVADRSAFAGLA